MDEKIKEKELKLTKMERENHCQLNSIKGYIFEDRNEERYTCSCTNDKNLFICRNCIEKCHIDHEYELFKNCNQKIKFFCKCDHGLKEIDKNLELKNKGICKISTFFSFYPNKSYKNRDSFFCLFCIVKCESKNNENKTFNLEEIISKEKHSCQCKCKHSFLIVMKYIFQYPKEFLNHIYLPQILPDVILHLNTNKKGANYRTFLDYLIDNPENYIKCMKFLSKFGKNMSFSESSESLIFCQNLLKDLKSKLSADVLKEDLELKFYCFKIIKQFYFDPKLIKFQLIKNEENMTIIHRSLFSQDFDNFIDLIKISRKELKKIMNNILMVIKISVECEEFENLTLPYKLIITFLDYLVDILSFNSEVEYLTYLKGISSILEGISSILILI